MRRCIAFFFCLSFCSGVFASDSVLCEKPITFLFGPLFSKTYIDLKFSDIHKSIHHNMGCEIDITIADNRDVYFEYIRENRYDMVLISSIHLDGIEKSNYQHLVSGFGPIEVVLLVTKRSSITQPKDLVGKSLLLNSDINIPAVVWRSYANTHGLSGRVNYQYPANVDSVAFELIKNKGDAALTYIGFYNRLPPNLKRQLRLLYSQEMAHPGTIVISKAFKSEVRYRLREVYAASDKWETIRPKQDVKADAIVNQKLDALLKKN